MSSPRPSQSKNSTHVPLGHRQCSAASRIAAIAILALSIAAWSAGPAAADGDPASDVLATQSLFLPWDAGLSATQQSHLSALLDAAARSGVKVRLAIVTSPTDLGSVSVLWREPHRYAAYLGEELSLLYRGPLLVLMPDGFGMYDAGRTLTAAESAIAGSGPPPPGASGLLAASVSAVRRLAGAAGRSLGSPLATTRPPAGTASSPIKWLIVAAGAALIIAAWAASLRARPLRLRSHPSAGN